MQILVNGAPCQIQTGSRVTDLIDQLGYTGKRIAVELNGEIVPKSRHAETTLLDDDQLEIVVAVGGG